MNRELFRAAAKQVRACEILVDVGAGIRPQNMFRCKRHICIEPHAEYSDALERGGYEVIRQDAIGGLAAVDDADTIIALDVIEHMTRGEGEEFIAKAVFKARDQVVIFTPLGFMPQSGGDDADPWGMQGQKWQEHKSGWTPLDFNGWQCLQADEFHHLPGKTYGAFFAIHG